MRKKIGWFAASVVASLVACAIAKASIVVYNQLLASETALSYNKTYVLDLQSTGIGGVSAQAVYSSATISNVTLSDGQQSVGTFTVNNYAALIAASATNTLTVNSNNVLGAVVYFPGYALTNGIDWATGANVNATATNLATAIDNTIPYLSVSVSGNVITLTAPAGASYNSTSLVTTSPNLAAGSPTFTGGQNNASFRINGTQLTQGIDWTASGSNNTTASSIATAINANSYLGSIVTAQAIGAVVSSTSDYTGSVRNYPLLSSASSALTASGSLMTGGTDASMTLNSTTFSASGGSSLTLALPVLYSSAAVTTVLGGLTNQATYYAIPVSGNAFMLSKYSTSAVAGIDLVTITSTNTQVTADSFTLAPLAISGTPGLSWSVSNDGTNYTTLNVSSITISNYTSGGATYIWPFGYVGERYLRLNATAPSTGGLNLQVRVIGTN